MCHQMIAITFNLVPHAVNSCVTVCMLGLVQLISERPYGLLRATVSKHSLDVFPCNLINSPEILKYV